MSTDQSSASAYEKVSALSLERDAHHRLRFALTRLSRAVLDVERELKAQGRYSDLQREYYEKILTDAVNERGLCWDHIQRLDERIAILVSRLNEGVYNNE